MVIQKLIEAKAHEDLTERDPRTYRIYQSKFPNSAELCVAKEPASILPEALKDGTRPEAAAPTASAPASEVVKVPCTRCGRSILPATAARTNGVCAPCAKESKGFFEL